jgi:NADH-quinone oxidoreductase subunit L
VLVFLAVFAVGIGWTLPFTELSIANLLEGGRPIGTLADKHGHLMAGLTMPDETIAHQPAMWSAIVFPAGLAAIAAAIIGIFCATVVYLRKSVSAEKLARALAPLYQLSWHKWWFDELYNFVFVWPTLMIGMAVAKILDKGLIDSILHIYAWMARVVAKAVAFFGDKLIIDNFVDTLAAKTWDLGLSLRTVQTGRLRQYVMFIVVGTILLFAFATWRFAFAG